jgi:carboxypeptidase Q
MTLHQRAWLALALAACVTPPAFSGDDDTLLRLRRAAESDSHVMQTATLLCDGIGARLTGSPQARLAVELSRRQLTAWGLSNVHLEYWDFARGWNIERSAVHLLSPEAAPLIALPMAWTSGTRGAVRGLAVHVRIASPSDLAQWRGRLSKKIVFLGDPAPPGSREPPRPHRWSNEELAALRTPGEPTPPPKAQELVERNRLRRQLLAFFAREGALAIIQPGGRSGGTQLVVRQHDSLDLYRSDGVTALTMADEHFGRVVRLLDNGVPVQLELDVRTTFHEDDRTSANVIADLPGSDLADEVVMLGAHLDSWHGGTGATDNAAGVAAAMEAMRLLKTLGVQPRRTIRLALWTGEEQGLLGSRAYAAAHLGHRSEPKDETMRGLPFFLRPFAGTLETKGDHARFDAYFNLDYGTGRIRGLYLEGDTAAASLLTRWLAPLADLGVSLVSPRSLVGSDHQAFESLGLPAFAFLQDDLDYLTFTHHTNMDVFERLDRDDLVQASIVAAWVVYQAAISDERVPRPTLPSAVP